LLRRKSQEAKTFELKFEKSKISKTKLAILNRLFLEAKWFTNYIIANGILQTTCGLQGKNGSCQSRQYVLGKGNTSAFISNETSPDKKASGQHTWEKHLG